MREDSSSSSDDEDMRATKCAKRGGSQSLGLSPQVQRSTKKKGTTKITPKSGFGKKRAREESNSAGEHLEQLWIELSGFDRILKTSLPLDCEEQLKVWLLLVKC
jgi:hypothetical protein